LNLSPEKAYSKNDPEEVISPRKLHKARLSMNLSVHIPAKKGV